MTHDTTTVRFEEIEHAPASELLKLSFEELDQHIESAQSLASQNQTIFYWLKGIKMEKTFRENTGLTEMGGEL